MAWKPTYDSRNRENIAKLADNTKAATLKWYDFLVANKIDLLIYETTRTEAQQRENVRKGASQTMKSYHLVGQALDFVPVKGKEALWNGYGSADVKKAVSYAKKLGFEWGGDWTGFVDKPHLQYNYKGYGTDTFGGKSSNKPASAPKAKSYLGKGDKGNDVKTLQSKLNAAGFNCGAADGIFGVKTEQAVKAFQKAVGLAVDGLYGAKTRAALESYKKPSSKPATPKGDQKTNSIVEYLNSIGVDSSFANREKLAKQYGIKGYKGTAGQNLELLEKMRKGSAPKASKPKGDQKTGSLVDYLKSIGEPSDFNSRAKLASKHGIKNYKGTAEQNTALLKKVRGH
ncbi:lysin, L-alanyl-D-glutamate peptidase [Bacillus phage 015DV002]|nr:lysin, L-alanyl-D-glutamate peptidase [Bacillus phage 000TH009]QQO41156.1 lysin, L-alanyl-D-glutamate peptidase [Bacillus phage 015DV002]